jgi:hypothetical protein
MDGAKLEQPSLGKEGLCYLLCWGTLCWEMVFGGISLIYGFGCCNL